MAERRREQYGLADGGLRWHSVSRRSTISSVKVAREEIDGGRRHAEVTALETIIKVLLLPLLLPIPQIFH
jgi:hypothetical protein